MNKKREITYIVIISVLATIIVIASVSGVLTGLSVKENSIPNEQCHNLASNLDNAVSNKNLPVYYSGVSKNPCTNTLMDYTLYLDPEKAFVRRVFENGDSAGWVMLTDYIVCTDGRAEVTTRLGAYYFNRGNYAWGLWLFNPHRKNKYLIEKCSTL